MGLSFVGVDLSKWAPGFSSEIAGKWGAHSIPGQRGLLQEDLGDGALSTPVQLNFSGPTAKADYQKVMSAITKTRRGAFQHPLRGTRHSVLKRIREEMRWTERGDAITLDLTFEDAVLAEADQFTAGPSVHVQGALARANEAESKIAGLKDKVFRVYAYNALLRQKIGRAQTAVASFTKDVRLFVNVAFALYGTALYAVNTASTVVGDVTAFGAGLITNVADAGNAAVVTYQSNVALLRGLPRRYDAAAKQLRNLGLSPSDTQPTINSMEVCLHQSTKTDEAIRATQPIPVESEVTRPGGQSIYGFVAQHYPNKTPQQQRQLVVVILAMNRHITRPDLIPAGTVVARPAA